MVTNETKMPEGAATPSGERDAAEATAQVTAENSRDGESPAEAGERKLRIYVASSWRCDRQPLVVERLRAEGFEVYDFKAPAPGVSGFDWREVDPEWQSWSASSFRRGLAHPVAQQGFDHDVTAMRWADVCVLVMPCGRSAHLEAGWFAGHPDKRLYILLDQERPQEPELMYLLANDIEIDLDELVAKLRVDAQLLGRLESIFGSPLPPSKPGFLADELDMLFCSYQSRDDVDRLRDVMLVYDERAELLDLLAEHLDVDEDDEHSVRGFRRLLTKAIATLDGVTIEDERWLGANPKTLVRAVARARREWIPDLGRRTGAGLVFDIQTGEGRWPKVRAMQSAKGVILWSGDHSGTSTTFVPGETVANLRVAFPDGNKPRWEKVTGDRAREVRRADVDD